MTIAAMPLPQHPPRRRALLALGAGLVLPVTTPAAAPADGPLPAGLAGGTPSFSEEFDQPPEVSAWGPSRWIAHTPWAGDFGEARFTDPGPRQAWHTADGMLTITARRNGPHERWTSGLLASSDTAGRGFRQTLGYFEARMRFPLARGTWPAFWLMATQADGPRVEVDIVEFYGRNPGEFRSVLHVWPNRSAITKWGRGTGTPYVQGARPDGFNLYGALVTAEQVTIYFNRQPVWQVRPPVDMRDQQLTLLLNLGIEPDAEPGEHRMDVDYVRAWAAA